MRIVSACRTLLTSAMLVLANVPPIDLLAEERKETFQLCKELTCLTNPQVIARAKKAICKEWKAQTRREMADDGIYLAQALSGHSCLLRT